MLSRTVRHTRTRFTQRANRTLSLGGNTTIVRFYSQYNWKEFNAGSCDIESVLESGKEAYPEVFKDSSVEFTVLKNSLIKREELWWKQKGFGRYKGHNGQSVADLILFDTHRRSLQITGALIPLLLKTPAQNNDFGVFVRDFHTQHILPVIPQACMLSQRKKYFNWVYDVLNDTSKQAQHPQIPKHFNKFKTELIKRREKGIIDGSDSMLSELAMTHVADELLKSEVDERIYTLSERVIEILIKQAKYESLPLVSAMEAHTFVGVQEEAPKSYPDRFTVLMAGGPGSGKSITTEGFALQLQRQTGYSLDELSLLTVDRKRTIYYEDECVKGTHKKHIGTLTHDEAVVTYNMSGEFLTRRMDQHKRVPNVFKEMCNIWPKWLDIGLKKDGTYLITVSTRKPENAVDGVIQRGISNNDFITPPEYVLNSYRSVSERFPLVIQENESKKVVISVVNNELAIVKKFSKEKGKDSKPEDNKPAVVVDCETNTIYVINLLQYVDFINQSQLNSKATSVDELFEGADISIAASMTRVIDPSKFGSAKIAFVRQGVTSTAINNLEKNVVATIQDGAFDVQDETNFEELKSDAPEHFEVLESFSSQNSLQASTK
ncbi:coiled-coil protein [Legionella tucsonensis]|uniref:Coiled-coil protein n=1 Tax=Legionella tucsonensis TaxID=40335 RepID=A0A0W0ZYD2_9GAMM|nr:coiled-coil protein [Legionella tucsonensis]